LVIPKKHSADIFEIDEATLDKIVNISKNIAQRMKDHLGIDGVNLYHASGIHAEQSVFHFHLHIVPRRKDDTFVLNCASAGKSFSKEEFEEVVNKLKIG
jgi:histidine triad (HIT) family protein